MRTLRWTVLVLGALLLLVVALLGWTLGTESGARWLVARAEAALDDKLAIDAVDGTVAGPLTIRGLRFVNPENGQDVQVGRISVDLELTKLLTRTVHVRSLAVADVSVALGERKEPPPEEEPFSLDPPIDIVVESAGVRNARIERNGAPLATVQRAELAGQWTSDGVAVRRLEIDAREGFVRFAGTIDERASGFVGDGNGRFRWQFGERRFAGALQASADGGTARADVRLTEPVRAQLDASLEQRKSLPWRLALEVERFDPRKELLPGGALESLAADLQGSGDRNEATLRGEVLVNGETVRIAPLHVALNGERLDLRALTLQVAKRPGTLHASGHVQLDADPLRADLKMRWSDVLLPPEWVGQPLATRGSLTFEGSTAAYDAQGELAVGPPKRLSDVRFAVSGTPKSIKLANFSIVQPRGRLAAKGDVQLQPSLRWDIDAEATHFDPGALLVAWPGDLSFDLATAGRMTPRGPSASLDLDRLTGTLRHRPISGDADLEVSPAKVVAGQVRLASGRSTIQLEGKAGNRLDLDAQLDIETLDDWVPGAKGSLAGRFDITGAWPDVRVDGTARGSQLALGGTSIEIVRTQIEVQDMKNPRGTVTLTARNLEAGGFDFAEVGIHADGGPASHTVRLRARGEPLSVELAARGRQLEGGWAGTLEQLALAAKDVPRLALRKPVQVSVDRERFSVSETCLVGREVALCAQGSGELQGEIQARYVIENLPLTLIRVFAAPDLPLAVGGAIQGKGTLRRATDGALYGDAELSSDEGRVLQLDVSEEPLLTWSNVRLAAKLEGDRARATLEGRLDEGGRLNAEAAIAGIGAPEPQLKGRADVLIADLRAVEIFTPQLAAVQGRVEARGSFEGTPGSLGIAAEAYVRDFAAEVPALGLKLREGNFEAETEPGGGARFAGRISSAEGQVRVDGTADPTGVLKATIRGNQVLAADIPAGRVVIDPELVAVRTPERVSLEGKITIPTASIDLTKLPQGSGKVEPSPDVVVVDEPAVEKEEDEFPLESNITIVVGPDVQLVGFGLDAQVRGLLSVRERPGTEPLASGEIKLEGTYKAYGQDLVIEEGRMLYAGTPLSNPRLDILAVRKLPEVTAQLRITGSAQAPELAVSAEPAMSQTEALSYLVRGKPLNALNSEEDGDLMQTAARSLGGAAGNLLAKNIGKRLGIDEIGIEQNEELGGSAFTVGEYLSPRLYLSYGFGLFEPGEVITLRYELSDELSLRVSQGSEDQRAGIEYRIER